MAKIWFSGEEIICRNLVILGHFREKIEFIKIILPPFGSECHPVNCSEIFQTGLNVEFAQIAWGMEVIWMEGTR